MKQHGSCSLKGSTDWPRSTFAAKKGPRVQWLGESTWEIMRRRTWLVDSLWNETDIAEVVRLSREIQKSCRRDKKQRIERMCEEMDEGGKDRDGKNVGMRKISGRNRTRTQTQGFPTTRRSTNLSERVGRMHERHFPRGTSRTTWTTTQQREHARAIITVWSVPVNDRIR